MPSIENWQTKPLGIIHDIFERKTDDGWLQQVREYFESHLSDPEKYAAVPSLNDRPLHALEPDSLVRFRCMVQDTYDNEFFLETYHLVDKEGGKKKQRTSCFQDVIPCASNCDIDTDMSENKTGMRQILYCVSVPGETDWVKEAWQSLSVIKPNTEGTRSGVQQKKRGRDEGDVDKGINRAMDMEGLVSEGNKRAQNTADNATRPEAHSSTAPVSLNHPLPGKNGPVCMVKVYDESSEFKVNEVLEFVGVLSVDPALSTTFDADSEEGTSTMDTGDREEVRAHHPPASLVPRLHVVSMRRMEHLNPHLPVQLTNDTILGHLNNEASSLRSSLLGLLTKATLGDALAAEYLLLHLLARVYARRDMLSLGKFSLNISGVPAGSVYPRILTQFLQELVTKMYYLPMTLENINSLRFTPTKNYSTNRLDSGILQLSPGTHLILDETRMQPGTVDANGVKNIQTLKQTILFQKVDYNFQFHEASFDCDINFLIFSEGKSLLPCDCQVRLNPAIEFPGNLEEYFTSICADCPVEFLKQSRCFLDCVRLLDYQVPDSMTKLIQEDFVAARREDERKVTAEDLHVWLIVARLLSLSIGQQTLNAQRWERVKTLEAQRRERLPESSGQPTAPRNGC